MKPTSHRGSSRGWRIAAAFLSLGLFAWGLAAWVYADTTGASAETNPTFHDVDAVYLVPQDGQWFYVKVEFLMADDGSGNFSDSVDAARAEMLARFPGAFEVDESVSAAFVTSGFKWMSGSSSWSYNGSGAHAGVSGTAQGALSAAAATWGQQGANFSFSGGGATGSGTGACGGGTDGSNTVGWANQSGSVLAVTCSWFGSSGSPYKPAVEFDMQIDPEWNWTTGSPIQVDLQSVALHEFGHALGLNHSASGSAVMFASYTNGTNKRTPTQDDIDGLLAIYGAQGGGNPTPTNTPSPTNTPHATNTPSPTNTPGGPSATPTKTPTPGGSTSTPTQPLPSSTPTKTPTPGSSPTIPGGQFPPTAPLPSSTPTNTPPGASPTATSTPTNTPTPSPTVAVTATPTRQAPPSLPIVPGANLFAWPNNDVPPAAALAGTPNIKVVYEWNPTTRTWSRYINGAPAYVNNLALLKKGGAYWFIATGAALIPVQ